jgi:peptidyl-dipeptidase Dcp
MAKNTETVLKFLDRCEEMYRPAAEKHLKNVRVLALETDRLSDLCPHDFDYYNNKLQEKSLRVDAEEVRPYLELENVLKGMHRHIEKLFNVKVTEEKTGKYPVHHPDVRVYEISDKGGGKTIGIIYTDYFARPGEKNSGAWMDVLRECGGIGSGNKCAIVINACNFARPAPEQPCLLSLHDVGTVFHEFGHALHALLAEGKYPSLTGVNVKWDFLELPSQLQEHWVQQEEVLSTFAKHHKTGEPLPEDLMKKAIALKNFSAGVDGMNVTFRARLDMAWYTTDPADIGSVEDFEDALRKKSCLFPPDGSVDSTSFDHIFAGGTDYAAGYYGYKWAEVLDADIFETFKDKGLYDPETARRLRDTIYSKGGTVDPMELFIAMQGRKPDPDALFRQEGLLPPKKPHEDVSSSRPPLKQRKII